MQNINTPEGMEQSLRAFVKRLNAEKPNTINAMLGICFEQCCFEDKSLVLSFDIQPWMSNPSDVAHGGALGAILDTAMGSLSFYLAGDRVTPTVSLQVSYLRPVALNSKLLVKVRATMAGRTMIHLTTDAYLGDNPGRILATAAGVYYSGK